MRGGGEGGRVRLGTSILHEHLLRSVLGVPLGAPALSRVGAPRKQKQIRGACGVEERQPERVGGWEQTHVCTGECVFCAAGPQ